MTGAYVRYEVACDWLKNSVPGSGNSGLSVSSLETTESFDSRPIASSERLSINNNNNVVLIGQGMGGEAPRRDIFPPAERLAGRVDTRGVAVRHHACICPLLLMFGVVAS